MPISPSRCHPPRLERLCFAAIGAVAVSSGLPDTAMVTTDVQPAVCVCGGETHGGVTASPFLLLAPRRLINAARTLSFWLLMTVQELSSCRTCKGSCPRKKNTEISQNRRSRILLDGILLFQERPEHPDACMGRMIGSGRASKHTKGFQADDKVTLKWLYTTTNIIHP